MRIVGFIAAASFAVLPFLSDANAADDGAKVYYKDGTRIETADFDMRINLQVQPRFTYEDIDEGGRDDAGIEDDSADTASFDLRRVRAIFSGNLLNKQFSYKVQNDFRSSGGGGQLKDAWLQWNSDSANVRWGQFKVPFSRQENVSSAELQFIDRSIVNDIFAPSRHMGAMVHGPIGDGISYAVGAFNGESVGEGINQPGVDNDLAVDAAISADFGDYGSRGHEGDHRKDKSSTAFTTGVAVIYGEGTGDPLQSDTVDDFQRFDLNVDAGMRSNGLSVQTEFYYSTIDLDSIDGDAGEGDLFGFYVQSGYMLDENWEPAVRFSYFAPDEDISDIDDIDEFNVVLNYYINGHNLKLQTGVTFEVTNFNDDAGGDDLSDFRFETQLAGYF